MAQKNRTGTGPFFLKILKTIRQKTIVIIFAMAALLISGFWTAHQTRKTAKDIELLQAEEGRLSAQYQDFSTQVDRLKARSRMEKLGKKMGLHPPTGRQIISLN